MNNHFELAIFTASVKEYADWILEKIDPYGYIKKKFYWEHTSI